MMVRNCLAETVSKRFKGEERRRDGYTQGRVFHQEETTSAKALRWSMLNVVME